MVFPRVIGAGIACLALVAAAATLSPAAARSAAAQPADGVARAVLLNAAGDQVGQATFTDQDGHVLVSAVVNGLPPDFHGFHVHGVGVCEAPDFMSAGGHFNPAGQSHPGHAGDLPSLLVNQDGAGELHAVTDRFSVADLLADAGTALIVHANRDNYANIPTRYVPAPDATTLATGDAGARIACGVLEPADSP
jgi:Cu-Zn family superoxide dismutase